MFGRVHIVDKKVEKFAYRRAVVAPGDELLATVRLDAHRETTVWLFALLLGLLPGYLVAVLVGLTKKSWLLVTLRQVIVTPLSRRQYSGLRRKALRLDRPVRLEVTGTLGDKVILPGEIAAFLGRRVVVTANTRVAGEAFEVAGTSVPDDPAAAREAEYAHAAGGLA